MEAGRYGIALHWGLPPPKCIQYTDLESHTRQMRSLQEDYILAAGEKPVCRGFKALVERRLSELKQYADVCSKALTDLKEPPLDLSCVVHDDEAKFKTFGFVRWHAIGAKLQQSDFFACLNERFDDVTKGCSVFLSLLPDVRDQLKELTIDHDLASVNKNKKHKREAPVFTDSLGGSISEVARSRAGSC